MKQTLSCTNCGKLLGELTNNEIKSYGFGIKIHKGAFDEDLAWASPAGGGSNGTFTSYNGVFRMPELSTIGQTTVLSYHCTSDIPQPVSGRNYSSGAPDFTADGTLTLTLLEN